MDVRFGENCPPHRVLGGDGSQQCLCNGPALDDTRDDASFNAPRRGSGARQRRIGYFRHSHAVSTTHRSTWVLRAEGKYDSRQSLHSSESSHLVQART